MSKRETCKSCGGRLQHLRLPVVVGHNRRTTVRFLHFPVLACASGHERWEAYLDFNPEIIDELFYRNRSIFSKTKGFIRKVEHCSHCGASLKDLAEQIRAVQVEIRSRKGMNFELEIEGPAIECPVCHRLQINDWLGHGDTIVEAMTRAFEQASIKRQ